MFCYCSNLFYLWWLFWLRIYSNFYIWHHFEQYYFLMYKFVACSSKKYFSEMWIMCFSNFHRLKKRTCRKISLSISHSYAHTHAHTDTQMLSPSLYVSLSLSHTLSHSHTHTYSNTNTLSHKHTHLHTLTHTNYLSLSVTNTHTHTHVHTHTHSLTQTHKISDIFSVQINFCNVEENLGLIHNIATLR